MDSSTFLEHGRRLLNRFRSRLDGDLTAPVEHCGDWTVRDLAAHVAGVQYWMALAITEKINGDAPPVPEDPAELLAYFGESSVRLLPELELELDPDTEAWTPAPPHNVGLLRRRWCLELLIHTWDAENAQGAHRPMDPELGGEAVLEVLEMFAPRMIERGRKQKPEVGVRLVATDLAAEWTYGPGEPIAEVRGTAEDLALLLWGRRRLEDGRFETSGDWEKGRSALTSMTP